jgi:hypothetical protein
MYGFGKIAVIELPSARMGANDRLQGTADIASGYARQDRSDRHQ